MHPNLSFEQAPPISVPFRFFLTAPLFGIAAGVLLAVEGGDMLASRWMPALLAATHFIVAGFMLQAMTGALMQFIPVAAGGNIWRPRWVAGFVHPLSILALLFLVAAFLTQRPPLFFAAGLGFALALGFFVLVAGLALWRTPAKGATIVALRIAVFGLAATLILGVMLTSALAQGSAPVLTLVDIHLAWGLAGWALMLLAGVSYFVVPMFQLTPPYPTWFARSLPFALLAFLLPWSAQLLGVPAAGRQALGLAGLALGAAYALATLWLQSRRRRKLTDTTFLFFRTAMLSLIALFLSALAFASVPGLAETPRAAVWLGMLAIPGVFVSAIMGMLYKIVPFLCWLHLQRLCGLAVLPPTMHEILAEQAMRRQFHLHLATLVCLLAAVWLPLLARPAGLLLAADCAWLGANLIAAVRAFRAFRNRIRAAA
ncbi:MAG: hypothetical protein N3C63_09500 [Rhodocyclaceae bacterium]|nr:hypothetical protein [Rhodocyclaceae bacterium]